MNKRMSEGEIHETVIKTMKRAGISPEFIYAYDKTGLPLCEGNVHLFTQAELDEWDAAVEEYLDEKALFAAYEEEQKRNREAKS